MNIIKAVILALLVVWLQLATLPAIRPLGIVPNLALVVVIILSIRLSLAPSLGIAAVIGWLLDSGAGSDYGLRTTFYVVVVLFVATLKQFGTDLENVSLQASLVVAGTVLINLVILANLAILHAGLPLGQIGIKLLLEVGLNLLILWPVRWITGLLIGRRSEMVVSIGGRRG